MMEGRKLTMLSFGLERFLRALGEGDAGPQT